MTKTARKIQTIDATGEVLGRLATRIAAFLIGKNKADYLPNIDQGDKVTIKNASKIRLTGKKARQKEYKHHTMYVGGLKVRPFASVFQNEPAEVIRLAVSRMLPKNKFRDQRMKRLKIEA